MSGNKPFSVTAEGLATIRDRLQELKPKEKSHYAGREAVDALAAEIKQARTLNYSFAEIAQFLADHGFAIKPNTLASYLREWDKVRAASAGAKAKAPPAKAKSQARPMAQHKGLATGAPRASDSDAVAGTVTGDPRSAMAKAAAADQPVTDATRPHPAVAQDAGRPTGSPPRPAAMAAPAAAAPQGAFTRTRLDEPASPSAVHRPALTLPQRGG